MSPARPPTDRQHHALMLAYSADHVLYGEGDSWDGPSRATIRSLLRRGWVTPVDPEDLDDELVLTPAGRGALGLRGALLRKPKRMKTAVVRAVGHFVDVTPTLRSAVVRPKQLSGAVWVDDERVADFTDALWVLDTIDADLVYGDGDGDEITWACVGTLITELGFPCYVDKTRHVRAFWPVDD